MICIGDEGWYRGVPCKVIHIHEVERKIFICSGVRTRYIHPLEFTFKRVSGGGYDE